MVNLKDNVKILEHFKLTLTEKWFDFLVLRNFISAQVKYSTINLKKPDTTTQFELDPDDFQKIKDFVENIKDFKDILIEEGKKLDVGKLYLKFRRAFTIINMNYNLNIKTVETYTVERYLKLNEIISSIFLKMIKENKNKKPLTTALNDYVSKTYISKHPFDFEIIEKTKKEVETTLKVLEEKIRAISEPLQKENIDPIIEPTDESIAKGLTYKKKNKTKKSKNNSVTTQTSEIRGVEVLGLENNLIVPTKKTKKLKKKKNKPLKQPKDEILETNSQAELEKQNSSACPKTKDKKTKKNHINTVVSFELSKNDNTLEENLTFPSEISVQMESELNSSKISRRKRKNKKNRDLKDKTEKLKQQLLEIKEQLKNTDKSKKEQLERTNKSNKESIQSLEIKIEKLKNEKQNIETRLVNVTQNNVEVISQKQLLEKQISQLKQQLWQLNEQLSKTVTPTLNPNHDQGSSFDFTEKTGINNVFTNYNCISCTKTEPVFELVQGNMLVPEIVITTNGKLISIPVTVIEQVGVLETQGVLLQPKNNTTM